MTETSPSKPDAALADPSPADAEESNSEPKSIERAGNDDITADRDAQELSRREEVKREKNWNRRRDEDRKNHRGNNRRPRNRPPRQDHRVNKKFDAKVLEKSTDPLEILKQVQFYFCDFNLASDKFLYNEVGGPENKAVALDTIMKFKRMMRFDKEDVVAALRKSDELDLIEDDGNYLIKRKQPLPEGFQLNPNANNMEDDDPKKAGFARTVYVKGFGPETPRGQVDIEEWFETHGGPYDVVRLRRTMEKKFKSSAWCVFKSEEDAKKFVEQSPFPQFQGRTIDRAMSKKDYHEMKDEQFQNQEAHRAKKHRESREKPRHKDDYKRRPEHDDEMRKSTKKDASPPTKEDKSEEKRQLSDPGNDEDEPAIKRVKKASPPTEKRGRSHSDSEKDEPEAKKVKASSTDDA